MIRKLICINSLAVMVLAAFFLIYPPVRAVLDIRDPAPQIAAVPSLFSARLNSQPAAVSITFESPDDTVFCFPRGRLFGNTLPDKMKSPERILSKRQALCGL